MLQFNCSCCRIPSGCSVFNDRLNNFKLGVKPSDATVGCKIICRWRRCDVALIEAWSVKSVRRKLRFAGDQRNTPVTSTAGLPSLTREYPAVWLMLHGSIDWRGTNPMVTSKHGVAGEYSYQAGISLRKGRKDFQSRSDIDGLHDCYEMTRINYAALNCLNCVKLF